jgi:hypothetical protein
MIWANVPAPVTRPCSTNRALNAADADVSAHCGDGSLCKLANLIGGSKLQSRTADKVKTLFPAARSRL